MISIITPSFNRAYIIDETAQSIFGQSSKNLEWIIVDDGSTDGSWEKIQAYADQDSRVRVFQRNREPKGACTCRNIGAEKAIGTHLMFLDTDDLLGPDAILNRSKFESHSPQNALPFFPIVTFETNPRSGFLWDDPANPVSWLTGLFTMTPPCQGTAPLWPREEFLRIGGWREDLRVWQDVELHIRAYVEGLRFEAVPDAEPDIFLRLSPDSISHMNFHSPEKVLSRWSVVAFCLNSFNEELTPSERQALHRMVLNVFENALNVRNFNLASRIIHHCSETTFVTEEQLNWMNEAQKHWKWRLYKIPSLKNQLERKKKELYPLQLKRKICAIPWSSNNSNE